MRRLIALVGFLAATFPAQAQQDLEIGARYWLSSGKTERSHNAQGQAPILGNPTSVLTYDNLDAHAVELHARKGLPNQWFIRGNAGLGRIQTGTFRDEDFLAGQIKFSESISSIKGKQLAYAWFDIGRDLWTFGGGATLALFAGYHHWTERADAYGGTFTVNFLGGPDFPNTVPVVSNEVIWRSLRVGVATKTLLDPRTRLFLDLAVVPYADMRDEDSHHLRTAPNDLGPTPNVILEGRGRGLQLDLEMRRLLYEKFELGIGFRHWWLRSTHGSRMAAGTNTPLHELESRRTGLTVSITRSW